MKGNTVDLRLLSAANMLRTLHVDLGSAATDAQRLSLIPRTLSVLACCSDYVRAAIKNRTTQARKNELAETSWSTVLKKKAVREPSESTEPLVQKEPSSETTPPSYAFSGPE